MPDNEVKELHIHGISYRCRQEDDWGWLTPFGQVFQVWDALSSGNLCFGVDGPFGRLFIKYAGSQPVHYLGNSAQAIDRLRASARFLARFHHPSLLAPIGHGPAGNGYAVVYPYIALPCLRAHPKEENVVYSVRHLPLEHMLRILDSIFDLITDLSTVGRIAAGLEESDIFIDFSRFSGMVCDIDDCPEKPAVNTSGRTRGTSRLMAPEQFRLGEALDERTSVYCMGALAFDFFSENDSRLKRDWFGPALLFEVATQATRKNPSDRYPLAQTFLNAWRQGVAKTFRNL